MPGMSGTEFLGAIKAAFPKVPVIVITAFGDWGKYMDAMHEGATEYLSKPLEKIELLAAIHRVLANSQHNAHTS
jgi:DNA-binding NtrC family response regulator